MHFKPANVTIYYVFITAQVKKRLFCRHKASYIQKENLQFFFRRDSVNQVNTSCYFRLSCFQP